MRNVILLLAAVLTAPTFAQKGSNDMLVYVGTYTRDLSKGIYAFSFDGASGKLAPLGLAAEIANPSYLTIHPNGKWLYSVTEAGGGAVSAFTLDKASGKLTLLNKVSSKGGGPCYLSVDATGKNVLVANYGTGSVASLPVKDDGSLGEATSFVQHQGSGPDKKRQQGPHGHSINLSPDNRFAIAADLGLDQLLVYKFDPTAGTLTPNDPPFAAIEPGGGPRHFSFHPNGKFGYTNNEMAMSVTALQWDARKGAFTKLQTVTTLPEGANREGASTAETLVHPNGRFVYVSNRGHDTIAIFAADPRKGTLKPAGHVSTQGKIPRNFRIDPSGRWLIAANQNTNNIVVFRIDPKTGGLTPTGQSLEVGAPVCIKFLPR